MDVIKIADSVRRAMMHALTFFVGSPGMEMKEEARAGLKRVLLCRPNGRLGNQLMITPLVQEIAGRFPGCRIDLFVKGSLSGIIFKNYEEVDRIIELPRKPFDEPVRYVKVWLSLRRQTYDLAVNVAEGSSSGRLSTRFARARWRFYNNTEGLSEALCPGSGHMAKCPVYNFRRYLACPWREITQTPVPPLNLRLSDAELANGRKVMNSYVSPAKKTICIYTFATGSKCYSEAWWAAMYARLKEACGDAFNILEVLPAENVSRIRFEAPAYYSKDVREIAAVIAGSALFLGADSGIMHLAASSGAPVAGLFSITDPSVYRPYGGHNLAIDTNTTDVDGIIAALNRILNDNAYLAPSN
ncbi:MAG: glycosyltransferase family 9 protein [Tannerellaceae bacterium]|jgi:ADP-heptose:LPS heptosyltransferase|nr:glycosyltransferase family 9 protein [Tannerellaceae bacterium]